MKKLIIQIPAFNEAKTLPLALKELPRQVAGFEVVEWLLIDDGSVDNTSEVAKANGVNYVVRLNKNQGLAKAFMAGIDACLKSGADVIINTDADNQYCAQDIPKLVEPILEGEADIVIGTRPIEQIRHFSLVKKFLQKFGSWTVRKVSGVDVLDAPSGFRAITREAAMRLNIFNGYTYTLEMIIQAGKKNISILSVPIRTNEDLRPSRLVKSVFSYIKKSIITIFRIWVVYRPFNFFLIVGLFFSFLGLVPAVRFLFFWFVGNGNGHIQSLILSSVLLFVGAQLFVLAFVGDLLSVNRMILEDIQYKTRKQYYSIKKDSQ